MNIDAVPAFTHLVRDNQTTIVRQLESLSTDNRERLRFSQKCRVGGDIRSCFDSARLRYMEKGGEMRMRPGGLPRY